MIDRRSVLGLAAAAVAFSATGALAEDWKAKYPELVFAVIPAENAAGVTERWAPFMEYLSKSIGTKVTLRVAQDYAGVIEGQKAGNIHIAYYGPASYARATIVGAAIEPFAIDVNGDGTKGYYSVFYVKKDSPYQKIEDLKGKNLGLVDPNSTSGFNMPKYALSKMGVDPEVFFSKVIATGSHENAVLALSQGTVDVCANWWNSEDDSNLTRMVNKKMVPSKDDFRIIFKSPLIINSPYAYLSDMPAELKGKIAKAFYDAAKDAPDAFAKLSDGKNKPWEPIDDKAYDDTRALIKYVDDLRKKKS